MSPSRRVLLEIAVRILVCVVVVGAASAPIASAQGSARLKRTSSISRTPENAVRVAKLGSPKRRVKIPAGADSIADLYPYRLTT